MKTIKTKEIMKAYETMKTRENNYEFSRKLKWNTKEDIEKYKKAYDDSKAEFINLASKADAVLDETQKKCKVRTINMIDVCKALTEINEKLSIQKKSMEGITVHIDINSQSFPKAYKYIPESTHFEATYKNGQWIITDVYRDICRPNNSTMCLTDEAKQAVLNRLTKW